MSKEISLTGISVIFFENDNFIKNKDLTCVN